MSNDTTSNEPILKLDIGGIHTALWENVDEKSTKVRYNVTIDNRYLDKKTGEFKSTKNYSYASLCSLKEAVQRNLDVISQLQIAPQAEEDESEEAIAEPESTAAEQNKKK